MYWHSAEWHKLLVQLGSQELKGKLLHFFWCRKRGLGWSSCWRRMSKYLQCNGTQVQRSRQCACVMGLLTAAQGHNEMQSSEKLNTTTGIQKEPDVLSEYKGGVQHSSGSEYTASGVKTSLAKLMVDPPLTLLSRCLKYFIAYLPKWETGLFHNVERFHQWALVCIHVDTEAVTWQKIMHT